MRLKRAVIDKKAKQDMSFIIYHEPDGVLAAIFSSMPLPLKQHCIRVGAVSGIIAEHAPERAIPAGMSRETYANAVRYGGFYHDLGAYLRHNRWSDYPAAGREILEREISEKSVSEEIRGVILETVGCACERCDGKGYPNRLPGREIPFHAGICAVADLVDMIIGDRRMFLGQVVMSAKKYIKEQSGVIFLPEVADSFERAEERIFALYKTWKNSPPMWKYNDLKPASKPYHKPIG